MSFDLKYFMRKMLENTKEGLDNSLVSAYEMRDLINSYTPDEQKDYSSSLGGSPNKITMFRYKMPPVYNYISQEDISENITIVELKINNSAPVSKTFSGLTLMNDIEMLGMYETKGYLEAPFVRLNKIGYTNPFRWLTKSTKSNLKIRVSQNGLVQLLPVFDLDRTTNATRFSTYYCIFSSLIGAVDKNYFQNVRLKLSERKAVTNALIEIKPKNWDIFSSSVSKNFNEYKTEGIYRLSSNKTTAECWEQLKSFAAAPLSLINHVDKIAYEELKDVILKVERTFDDTLIQELKIITKNSRQGFRTEEHRVYRMMDYGTSWKAWTVEPFTPKRLLLDFTTLPANPWGQASYVIECSYYSDTSENTSIEDSYNYLKTLSGQPMDLFNYLDSLTSKTIYGIEYNCRKIKAETPINGTADQSTYLQELTIHFYSNRALRSLDSVTAQRAIDLKTGGSGTGVWRLVGDIDTGWITMEIPTPYNEYFGVYGGIAGYAPMYRKTGNRIDIRGKITCIKDPTPLGNSWKYLCICPYTVQSVHWNPWFSILDSTNVLPYTQVQGIINYQTGGIGIRYIKNASGTFTQQMSVGEHIDLTCSYVVVA